MIQWRKNVGSAGVERPSRLSTCIPCVLTGRSTKYGVWMQVVLGFMPHGNVLRPNPTQQDNMVWYILLSVLYGRISGSHVCCAFRHMGNFIPTFLPAHCQPQEYFIHLGNSLQTFPYLNIYSGLWCAHVDVFCMLKQNMSFLNQQELLVTHL